MVVTCILGEGTKVAGTLLPELASDHDTLRRFRREAEAAAGLGHPNIVQIIELVEEPSEAPILVMELVRGQSLRQLIAAEGQLAPARAAFIAMQVLSALAVTHEAHIIHRDIKPANVFISETRAIADFVTLLDFGVAKRPRRLRQHHPAPLTRFGQVIGTRSYMAPEQTPGLTATERSDLFAVGALLFHALTGGTLYACAGAPTPDEFARGQRPLASLRHFAPWLDASLVAVDVAATTRDDPSVSARCVSTETSDGPATSTQVLAPCRVRSR